MKNEPTRTRKTRSRATSRRTWRAGRRGALRDVRRGAAVGDEAVVLRAVAQRGEDDDERQDRRAADDGHRPAPVAVGRQVGHQRQEDQLAGGVGGGEHPDDEAAAGDEPAVGDGRGEDGGDGAGRGAGEDAPDHVELPELRGLREQRGGEGDRAEGDRDDLGEAEALGERGGERGGEAEDHQVDRGRGGDRAVRPAELHHQRLHQDAERRPDRRGREQRDEPCGGDQPCAMDPHGLEPSVRGRAPPVAETTMFVYFLPMASSSPGRRVVVLLMEGSVLFDVGTATTVFGSVEAPIVSARPRLGYALELAAAGGRPVRTSMGVEVAPTADLGAVRGRRPGRRRGRGAGRGRRAT